MGIATWASPNGIEVGIERPRSSITDYRVFRFRGQDRLWTSHENSNVESSETRGLRSSIDFYGDTNLWSSGDHGHLLT
jgi:hypothetical protein